VEKLSNTHIESIGWTAVDCNVVQT